MIDADPAIRRVSTDEKKYANPGIHRMGKKKPNKNLQTLLLDNYQNEHTLSKQGQYPSRKTATRGPLVKQAVSGCSLFYHHSPHRYPHRRVHDPIFLALVYLQTFLVELTLK